jgi:hypothetical protein
MNSSRSSCSNGKLISSAQKKKKKKKRTNLQSTTHKVVSAANCPIVEGIDPLKPLLLKILLNSKGRFGFQNEEVNQRDAQVLKLDKLSNRCRNRPRQHPDAQRSAPNQTEKKRAT